MASARLSFWSVLLQWAEPARQQDPRLCGQYEETSEVQRVRAASTDLTVDGRHVTAVVG
jgi:hypothetical protein